MKRRLRRICLLAMALLLAMQTAQAEGIDLSARGTLRLEMRSGDMPVSGGVFRLYQVGSAAVEGGDLHFSLTPDFRSSGVSLENLQESGLAQALSDYAERHSALGHRRQTANAAGEAVFSDLGCGLYLLMQAKADADYGYERIAPFLVSMPMRGEQGGWSYSIIANPKLQVKPTPSPAPSPTATPRPSSKPSDKLPQTGMLLWPIPVLGAAGVALFVLGWILCFSGKRHE